MTKPTDDELAALRDSGPLLRFAAERVKSLDPDLSLALAEANIAVGSGSWAPQISQRFWGAFSRLCDLISPVTLDCISMAAQIVPTRGWLRLFGIASRQTSLAERSSSRYLKLLIVVLIVFILPLQLYVWVCTNLSKKLDEAISTEQGKLVPISEDFRRLTASTSTNNPDGTPHVYTGEETAASQKMEAYALNLNATVDRIIYDTTLLRSLLLRPAVAEVPERSVTNFWYEDYNNAVTRFSMAQVAALKAQEAANLVVGVSVAFILPILFGTLGAIAYVIRAISDQIRNTTFLPNSPIRHQMRVALGALMGVVVGLFQGLSGQLSLPPLALSFLAGYGVEAVFSMFDSVIDKLKEVRQPGSVTSDTLR